MSQYPLMSEGEQREMIDAVLNDERNREGCSLVFTRVEIRFLHSVLSVFVHAAPEGLDKDRAMTLIRSLQHHL